MAIADLEPGRLQRNRLSSLLDKLYAGTTSAITVAQAPHQLHFDAAGRASLDLPWINGLGLFAPDRATELGGTAFFPDMPAHIDPHPKDRLKVLFMAEAKAIGRFTIGVPTDVLDATNELPGSDYTVLAERGLPTDEVLIDEGTAVCFLGSITLHQFTSIGWRESYINSYEPVSPRNPIVS